jgi:hypothetical protein
LGECIQTKGEYITKVKSKSCGKTQWSHSQTEMLKSKRTVYLERKSLLAVRVSHKRPSERTFYSLGCPSREFSGWSFPRLEPLPASIPLIPLVTNLKVMSANCPSPSHRWTSLGSMSGPISYHDSLLPNCHRRKHLLRLTLEGDPENLGKLSRLLFLTRNPGGGYDTMCLPAYIPLSRLCLVIPADD